MRIEIWVCPDAACGNYYGSSSILGKDLRKEMNTKLNSTEPTHSRARCPDCGEERQPLAIVTGGVGQEVKISNE